MQRSAAWIGLVFLAILLIVAGVQGNIGELIAIVFVPDRVQVEA